MVKLNGTTITMTRGDTFKGLIALETSEHETYFPEDGDVIRFAAKSKYTDEEPCIFITIPNDTMILEIKPEHTKNLKMGKTYVYDIQLTKADGTIDTFIDKASLILTEEVD